MMSIDRHRISTTHVERQLVKIKVDEQLIGVFLEIDPVCPAVPEDRDIPGPDQIPCYAHPEADGQDQNEWRSLSSNGCALLTRSRTAKGCQ